MAAIELVKGSPRDVRMHVGWQNIQELREAYYSGVFGETIGPLAVQQLVRRTTSEAWDNPNIGQRRSRRARPTAVVARNADDKEVLGLAYVADDASKTTSFPFKLIPRALQEPAKLQFDALVGKRWAWVRELIGQGPLADYLLYEAISERNPRQPSSVYPYAGETALMSTVTFLGYHPNVSAQGQMEKEAVMPLGPLGPEFTQYTFTASSVEQVMSHAAKWMLAAAPNEYAVVNVQSE